MSLTVDTAVVLAGGLGTRLRPYTTCFPKPLMPVGEYPILEIVIKQLAQSGIKKVILAVNHQAELIKAYFQDGKKWNIEIEYSLERKRLGTMGPLTLMKTLPENFLIMNGDILCNLDFREFISNYIYSKNKFSIAAKVRQQINDYGVLAVENNRLIDFKEKPITEFKVSMGIYAASKSILDYVPIDTYFGFDDLMFKMLEENDPVNVYEFNGSWLDIGRADDYEKAIDEFSDNEHMYLEI